ncbi:hypothetical protein B0T16DRAFT_456438 [Cercophora newfieldiana]|uniref:Uncharacterized protein n=1 Tax=Cercophora newfieldiana TaxID=92897 RepID=A0AA39YCF9_9PEZI|nr:hypothetical protein B0T16DRAFT_456438 [Cercophora newfieldiana]
MANPPMPTPFMVPDICSNLTVTTSATYAYGTHRPLFTIVIPNEADPRYTSCHPLGWISAQAESTRFVFSPAVCPGDWTAYNINATGKMTGAKCCPSGFTYQQTALTNRLLPGFETIPGFSGTLCSKTLTSTTSFWAPATPTTSVGTSPQPTSTEPSAPPSSELRESTKTIFQVLHPYTIEWHESDRENLSPEPPSLACPSRTYVWTTFASWDPSEPAPTISCNSWEEPEPPPPLDEKHVPMVAAFSILGAIFIAMVLSCYFSSRRRRAKEEAQAAAAGHELGVVVPGKDGSA